MSNLLIQEILAIEQENIDEDRESRKSKIFYDEIGREFIYNKNGNLEQINWGTISNTFTYNEQNQLIRHYFNDGITYKEFGYDSNGKQYIIKDIWD